MNARWYDVTVNVSKQYFNNGSETTNGSFFIETKPVTLNSTAVSTQGGDVGGWGERFYFTANVSDEDYDYVNVTLYVRRVGSPTWITANQTNLDSPVLNTTVNLSWVRSYCEAGPADQYPHVWEFSLNTTDNYNNPLPGGDVYETTIVPVNFSLEKDNVTLQMMQGTEQLTPT